MNGYIFIKVNGYTFIIVNEYKKIKIFSKMLTQNQRSTWPIDMPKEYTQLKRKKKTLTQDIGIKS